MRASVRCISCMTSKQEKKIKKFNDENKKNEYMNRVKEILNKYGCSQSAPWLSERISNVYAEFFGDADEFAAVKQKYNDFLLAKEEELENNIISSPDPIQECIKYVCAANYIDFSAVEHVNEAAFESLLEKAHEEKIAQDEYLNFKNDLSKAKTLVYLTDNCGEIVVDKIFIKFLKQAYPMLQITCIVRGENTINDATMCDAEHIGLTEIVPCIGNGNGAPGTVVSRLSDEAKHLLSDADMIISKGQGNFEGLFGEGFNPYYLFLCKCDLFVDRFGLEKFSTVFSKEERIKINDTI